MSNQNDAESLEQLLDQLAEADDGDQTISVDEVLDAVGRRSFGPVLLIPGLIALSPVSGIPGAPTVVGIMVLLITGQFLLGRSEFWLPQFVLRRSVSQSRYEKALKVLRPVARFVDRLIKPRLRWLTAGLAVYAIAIACLLLSLSAPLLEAVPFAITGVGAAITAFGLSLLAHDGLLTLLAAAFCVATAYLASITLF